MTASVFVGTSLDGFIARLDGSFDFLPADGGEAHGYDEFMAGIDAIVMGRNTFETVLTLGAWPYGGKRVVVLSSRPLGSNLADLSEASGAMVEQMAGPPAQIVSDSPPAPPTTSTSTEESQFSSSCARDSFSVSLSRVSLCSSEREFLSSAACHMTFGSVT